MKFSITGIIISVSICLASCAESKKIVPENTAHSQETSSESKTVIPEPSRAVYHPSETRVNDILHTRLEVSFDYKRKRMAGRATVDVKPYFYPVNRLILHAQNFDIHKVQLVNGEQKTDLRYEYNNNEIEIHLDRYYNKNETYRVFIDYTAKPDERPMGGSAAIAGDKGLYFINTDSTEENKHVEIWTQGETESNSAWFPTIDKPNEKMTHEILITVPDVFETLSTGLMISSVKNTDGTRTDHWKMSLPHAPYLVMMTIGDFAVVRDTWKKMDGTEMEVSYYVEKEYEQYARDIFGKTPKMIEYFSRLLGVEYPWEKYAQIVVRDYVSGAMENTTATIHGEFLYKTRRELLDGNNESIIAHELFHHWFGDLVTCESWSNLPLNESFANYSQYLWDEYEYGPDEADHHAYNEMRGYLRSSMQNGYSDMVRFNYHDKEEMFDAHSYNKGGRILHMLRSIVGDSAFFTSLKVYLTENSFKPAEMHQLRLAFEEVTGRDLNWFYNQWFFSKGHPVLQITQEYDQSAGNVQMIVEQKQNLAEVPLYYIPVEIDVYTAAGKTKHQVILQNRVDTFNFPSVVEPLLVNFDAQKIILCEKEEIKPLSQWIFQYKNAPEYLDRREALEECAKSNDIAAQKIVLEAMQDNSRHIRELAVKHSKRITHNYLPETRSALTTLASGDKDAGVRSSAIVQLVKAFPDDNTLLSIYEEAIKDSSYEVAASGIFGISKIDPDRAMVICKSMENEDISSVRNTVAEVYSEYGGADQHNYFRNNLDKIKGFEKFSFLNSYFNFLIRQTDEEINAGIAVFESLAREGKPWWIKYSGYQKLYALKIFYQNKMEELKKKEESLRKEGNSVDADIIFREINQSKAQEQKISRLYEKLKSSEQDEKILQYLEK